MLIEKWTDNCVKQPMKYMKQTCAFLFIDLVVPIIDQKRYSAIFLANPARTIQLTTFP